MPGLLNHIAGALWSTTAFVLFILTALILLFIKVTMVTTRSRAELARLEKRMQLLTSGSVGMGERLLQLEASLKENSERQRAQADADAQGAYTQALKLLESGVDHSLISMNCGLSDSEVKLMELLYKTRSTDTRMEASDSHS